MAEFNTLTTLNGFFKTVYADSLENLIPEGVKLSKMIPFVTPVKRMGLEYKQPVTLGLEHGVTYGGESGDSFTLNDAIAGAVKEATVKGCEMVLRGRVSLGAVSRSISDEASFGRATKHVVKNLMVSTFKKHEYQLFYGQVGLGTVAAYVEASKLLTITTSEWAPGIWAGAENMRLDLYNVTDAAFQGVKVRVAKVDIRNRKLTLDFSTATSGSSAGLDTDINTDGDDVVIYEHGAKGNECAGLHKILTEESGSIFGISTADYSLWRGNNYALPSAGALTFTAVSDAIAEAVAKGLESKLDFFVNPKTWSDLLSEQTAKRMFDSSYDVKKYENGSESIVFHSQNGLIEIHSSTYVKEGYAYGLELGCFERVGSSEITFKIPGRNEDFMVLLENAHGIEFRTYCDLALFCNALGHNIVISNIVN